MKARYTPKPWDVGWYKSRRAIFDSRGNKTVPIATIHDMVIEGSEGNTHLISAAPDLLEALIHFRETTHRGSRKGDVDMNMVDAAIRKSKGEL